MNSLPEMGSKPAADIKRFSGKTISVRRGDGLP